jgi:hypothetical protein
MGLWNWAAHPNAALRLEIAKYIGRGFEVESLENDRAIVIKRSRFSLGKFALLGSLYLWSRLGAGDQRHRLTVGPHDVVYDERLPSDPRHDPPAIRPDGGGPQT